MCMKYTCMSIKKNNQVWIDFNFIINECLVNSRNNLKWLYNLI